MSKSILWAGRAQKHLDHVLYWANKHASVEIRSATLSLPEQAEKDGSALLALARFLSANRLQVEPFDLLVVGISWTEMENLIERDPEYLGTVEQFRRQINPIRLLTGRSVETVPVLLVAECMSVQELPTPIVADTYQMGTSHALGKVATGLLNLSLQRFLQALDVVGFSLVPEGDQLVPYLIARDLNFKGHSDLELPSPLSPSHFVASQLGGWFLLTRAW